MSISKKEAVDLTEKHLIKEVQEYLKKNSLIESLPGTAYFSDKGHGSGYWFIPYPDLKELAPFKLDGAINYLAISKSTGQISNITVNT